MDGRELIVVIEDDPEISQLIELYLRRDGFDVLAVDTGERGLEVIDNRGPCLVVLDIGLAGAMDGLQVCRRLRETSAIPVVVVTARDDEVDRVVGLELGADDYVVKPFSPRELVARIRAVLRRVELDVTQGAPAAPAPVTLGRIVIDRARHEVRVADVPVALTAREYELLTCLADHRGLALSRRQLLDGAWGSDWIGDERTVDVHVRQLRRKLGADFDLETVRGFGYRLG